MAVPHDRLVLSLKEYAERMGISEKAARQQVARRQIPFKKLGGRVVIPLAELSRFLQSLPGTSVEEALAHAVDTKD